VNKYFFRRNAGQARGVMRADIHHLFPTHKDPNQFRGHEPFGEIEDDQPDTWFGVNADGTLYAEAARPDGNPERFAEDNDGEFEPPEGQKGNTARAVFYFYTMYPDTALPIAEIAADGLEQLYRWHRQDPPDAAEIARNARTAACQGNRNPYVDHPALLCRAWGFDCGD
jgi:endonuclease I